MLTSILAKNRSEDILSLPLETPENGIIVAGIDGLGPVKASIASSSFAGFDGSIPQAARRDVRNILIKFDLDPFRSVEDTRKLLYKFFLPKSYVTLVFTTDQGLNASITGMIESCDPVIFSKEPQMTVSIICFEPDFKGTNSTRVQLVADGNYHDVEFNSEIETGFSTLIHITEPMQELQFDVISPFGRRQRLNYSGSHVAGDLLEISTKFGAKGAYLTRNSNTTSVLYGVTITSEYPVLYPGTNKIMMETFPNTTPFALEFEYRALYGGF